jgi:valyl-tRNA synthetase
MSIDLTKLPERYDPKSIEDKWQASWDETKIHCWDPSRPRNETYVVDTPPPTVSGSLHVGHMFSYTQTDLLVRFNRMRGKNIFYPMGWDDNGLPTERRVQNVFGVRCDVNLPYKADFTPTRNKKDSDPAEHISRKNFIETCDTLTKEDEAVFKKLWRHLGLSIDWSLEYATIDAHCRKISQMSFLDLVKKGQVYSLETPAQWDVDFQTAVAQAECEDREVEGFFHHLKFRIEGTNEDFPIATTRPELLPACIAVVAHPDDERFKKYFGKFALTPLFKARVPILPSEHADPTKGTGILMICTFGDSADIEWWKQSKLPIRQVIGANGRMRDITFGEESFSSTDPETANRAYATIKNLFTKQAQKKIVELLKDPSWGWDSTPLMEKAPERTLRAVKFYEKGDRPLEFIPSRQWFIKILEHKADLLEQGKKIKWHPEHMRHRYDHWVEGLNQDWCLSRQRYFGVPFPVWYHVTNEGTPDYDRPIFASEDQLPVDPLADCPKGFTEQNRGVPGGFTGDKDVMDTWATSSMTPQIATKWTLDKARHEKLFPMDLRPQSHEIIRTWAFYTIVKAWLHEKKIPWENVAISGWILDPDRKKMSKSKGNVVTPDDYLNNFSADAVRYWASRARLGVDTAFDENMFKIGKKLANKLFNASRFVMMQLAEAPADQVERVENIIEPIDRVWFKKMLDVLDNSTKAFTSLDYASALQLTEDVFWIFCDHYLELVKIRAYSGEGKARLSAQTTLNLSLKMFIRLFAPFFPYLCDEIWSWHYASLASQKSVHKNSWPTFDIEQGLLHPEKFQDVKMEIFDVAREALSLIRSAKTLQQKKLRWPVETLELVIREKDRPLFEAALTDVCLTGNLRRPFKVVFNIGELPESERCQAKVTLALEDDGESQAT